MADIGYAMNYQYINEIDMAPGAAEPTWGWFGQGISSITQDKSETTTEEYYYDGFGQAETSVDGLSKSVTIEGKRRLDDVCQNWVASLEDEVGDALNTTYRQTDPTGKVIERDVTIHEIKAGQDGAANEKAKFSCKLSFNGQPRVVEDGRGTSMPESLTVPPEVSVTVGSTAPIKATVAPETASSRCAFATGNHMVATVSPDGTITGVGVGETRITVKCTSKPSVAKQVKVVVAAAGSTTPDPDTTEQGEAETLSAKARAATATSAKSTAKS